MSTLSARAGDRAVERDLERLVARVGRLEREVVAEDHEALVGDRRRGRRCRTGPRGRACRPRSGAGPSRANSFERRLHERALAGAARAGEAARCSRAARRRTAAVFSRRRRFCSSMSFEVREADRVRMAYRPRGSRRCGALAPAKRARSLPVGRRCAAGGRMPLEPCDRSVEAGRAMRFQSSLICSVNTRSQ